MSSPGWAALSTLWPANKDVSACRKGHPGGTGVPGERQMVRFPSAGTQSLLWCNVMAESTAPTCGIMPQCPDSTGVATPGKDAVPGTGCRTGIVGADTRRERWGAGGGQCYTGQGAKRHPATDEHQEARNPSDEGECSHSPAGQWTWCRMVSQDLLLRHPLAPHRTGQSQPRLWHLPLQTQPRNQPLTSLLTTKPALSLTLVSGLRIQPEPYSPGPGDTKPRAGSALAPRLLQPEGKL